MNIQKILPACAAAMGVALVVATSAFKQAPKNKSGDTLYTFAYNAPATNPYSQANVENESNWSYTSDTDPCDNSDVEACKIQVPVGFVNNPGGTPTLKSSTDISAVQGDTNIYYVSSTAAGNSGTISNKSE